MTAALPTQTQSGYNPIQRLGVYLMFFYLFCVYTRVLDFIAPRAHLPAVMTCVMLTLVMFGGGILEVLSTPASRGMVWFTAWMIAVVPFSFWRSGSLATIQTQWIFPTLPCHQA